MRKEAGMLDMTDGEYVGTQEYGMVREDVAALLAASFPVKPSGAWFVDPKFRSLKPLTVDNAGRVSGHIASWKQSHIGMGGSVRAPKSRSKYAFFKTGALELEDGQFIDVGQITLAGGHAPLDATVADAVAHYDDTKSAVMDVNVGEDRHGIWVAGALRPNLDESDLRAIRAASVSGDWRPINGNLELVAVCAVNVPGFPIPRARVAAGQPIALVAAGTAELVQVAMEDRLAIEIEQGVETGLADVIGRVETLENASELPNIARLSARRRTLVAHAIETVQNQADEHVADLRSRVHADEDVGTDGMPMETTIAAALRGRVHEDGLTAAKVSTGQKKWKNPKSREKAAGKGQALPDGSFPIRDKADLKRASQALGRAKDRAKVLAHIRKRAKALGATDLVKNLKAQPA
jgi:hypothetical protein